MALILADRAKAWFSWAKLGNVLAAVSEVGEALMDSDLVLHSASGQSSLLP